MKGESRSQQCALALLTVDRAMRLLADARKSEDAQAAVHVGCKRLQAPTRSNLTHACDADRFHQLQPSG